jgi:DNA gyrase/topoisomerase IV subunit B
MKPGKIKTNAKDYTAKDVQVLEALDGVRARPTMYIGSVDGDGLFQMLKEIADNGADEALAGRNDYVGVHVADDGATVTVWDKGGGVPVEKHPKTGKSTVIEIFTKLHAGGKFGGKAYDQGSKGVHGVGASVTNALSESFMVWTCRNSQWYNVRFAKGKLKGDLTKCKAPRLPNGDKAKRGTIITYKPDASCFKAKVKLDTKKVNDYLELQSYLHAGVTFALQAGKLNNTYKHEKGLAALLDREVARLNVEVISRDPFIVRDGAVDVALRWTEHDEEYLTSYVNGSLTRDGGTHTRGLYDAMNDALKPYKGKRDYTPADIRCGLIGVLNAGMKEPEFSSQTKEKLIKESATRQVYDVVKPAFDAFFKKNKSLVANIIKRAEELKKLRSEFTANKKAAARIKSTKERALLPAKLSTSTTRDPKKRELFLVEGDSAGGTAKLARDANYQEILKLRGKVLNAYGPSGGKIFDNKEVLDILRAIGYEANSKVPTSKLRVGKIILLADPDVDGKHITVLLLSLFQRLMPRLFTEGRIYAVDSLLFNAYHGGKRYFGKSVDDVMHQLPKGTKLREGVQRIKGWGEVSPNVLEAVAFGPERRLIKVKPIEGDKLRKFVGIVGENAAAKRELLGV